MTSDVQPSAGMPPRPPKGTRWGGREKGTPNKVNQSIRESANEAFAEVGGQEHMEHIEHVFSYIIPGARSSWSFGLAAFLQSFSQKYVFHVFCVFSQRKFANAVCSVMCSNVFTGEMAGIISSLFCATCASCRANGTS